MYERCSGRTRLGDFALGVETPRLLEEREVMFPFAVLGWSGFMQRYFFYSDFLAQGGMIWVPMFCSRPNVEFPIT